MSVQQFYYCTVCGANLAGTIKHSGVPMCCCNREMTLLEANRGDYLEDHSIDIRLDGHRVHVSINDGKGKPHPLAANHHIEWIYLHTQEQGQRKMLQPGKRPEAVFFLKHMESAILYAYCSRHGLWEQALPSPCAYKLDR